MRAGPHGRLRTHSCSYFPRACASAEAATDLDRADERPSRMMADAFFATELLVVFFELDLLM